MPSTYSDNLRLEIIQSGAQSNTWGVTTNNNIGVLIDQAIAGLVTIDVSAGDVTLDALNGAQDQSRRMILNITGFAGTPRQVYCPNTATKVYVVANGADDDVEILTTEIGSVGATIAAGSAGLVYSDGTDVTLLYGAEIDALTVDLALKLSLSGGTMSGPINMGTNKITNLGTPTTSADAVTKAYADLALPLAGGTMTGAINMGTSKITNLGTPTVNTDAVTKAYADSLVSGTGFAAGTTLLFYQASAPTGWTQVTTHNNKALRVVSSTGGGSGGSVAFTTAFASQTPAGSVSVSGSVGGYTLTSSDIPSHNHSAPSGWQFVCNTFPDTSRAWQPPSVTGNMEMNVSLGLGLSLVRLSIWLFSTLTSSYALRPNEN
jgi:hypothetical protein